MINKDSEQIAKLYEAIQEIDYFTNSEVNFNWKDFNLLHVENFNFNSLNSEIEYFLESFDKIKSDSTTQHGKEDVYEIVLHNGLKFYLHINFIQPSNTTTPPPKCFGSTLLNITIFQFLHWCYYLSSVYQKLRLKVILTLDLHLRVFFLLLSINHQLYLASILARYPLLQRAV